MINHYLQQIWLELENIKRHSKGDKTKDLDTMLQILNVFSHRWRELGLQETVPDVERTPLQLFDLMGMAPESNYLRGEILSVCCTMQLLKTIYGSDIRLGKLLEAALHHGFVEYQAKARDFTPHLDRLAAAGLIEMRGSSEDPDTVISLSARGYLSQPHEWF